MLMNFKTFKNDKTLVSVVLAYGFIFLSLFEYTLIFSKIVVVDIIWGSVSLPLGMIAAVAESGPRSRSMRARG